MDTPRLPEDWLIPTPAQALEGTNHFAGVNATVLDFWRWAFSDLWDNTQRGVLAEFLVALALGRTEARRKGWDNYDVVTSSEDGVDAPINTVQAAVDAGLRHPVALVRAAAISVIGRVSELIVPADLVRVLLREEDEVCLQIVRALGHRADAELDELLNELATNRSKQVRWVVIELAEQRGKRELLERIASDDVDAYARGLASRACRRME